MPEFKQVQTAVLQTRKQSLSEASNVFRVGERLKKLARKKQKVARGPGKNSDEFKTLVTQETRLAAEHKESKGKLDQLKIKEHDLLEAFIPFTDPRNQVNQLSDNIPILMFPVRLETRFKIVDSDQSGGRQHQLWVRVFPDECSINTFDETLSEAEIKKAQRYWIEFWKAGEAASDDLQSYVDNKRRGAWRDLMGTFKAGRAHWVEQNYIPVNSVDIPQRNNKTDLIMVIATEILPDATTQDALKTYWTAVLLAQGNAETAATAFNVLVNVLGGDETAKEAALSLLKNYKPDNFNKIAIDADSIPDISLVFLHFKETLDFDSKLAAWSQPARVTTLPERFVLLAYQNNDDGPIVVEIGKPIPDPLVVGPDPNEDIKDILKEVYGEEFEELSDSEKTEKYVEYLSTKTETSWLFDFEEAIGKGMGFKVNLDPNVYQQGFSRLFVLGVKLSADETEGKELLEKLIKNHHYGASGFAVLPQGAATNNTEDNHSAYSMTEDPDEAYDRYHPVTEIEDPDDKNLKLDGRWLADLLGIDKNESTLIQVSGYEGTDQCEARAMNTALWNATIGYFMESMLTPVFNESQRELTRMFLINYVSGRGRLPALRIGNQPYGILPVTRFSNMRWFKDKRTPFARGYSGYFRFLSSIDSIIKTVRKDWSALLEKVAYVGKEGDSEKTLLQALGLHANSVEFDQRYAQSFEHLYNQIMAQGGVWHTSPQVLRENNRIEGLKILKGLGYQHDLEFSPDVPILTKFFLTKENDVNKPLIDDQVLSEIDPIRDYTELEENYIEWLIDKAKNNHDDIKRQKGFKENKQPYALLYDMLRHAVNLEFANTGLKLYRNAGIINDKQMAEARIDSPFIGVQEQPAQLESKWDLVYRKDSRIVGNDKLVVDHISELIKTNIINSQTRHLHEVLGALEHLKHTPTAKLERAFVEHLDCCTYRLDAWLMGLVNLQLHGIRFGDEQNDSDPSEGIYIGAFGWLENLKPDNKVFTAPDLSDELNGIFNPEGDNPPLRDNMNAGYVHAPSINHGITAAVLRNAYISNASEEDAEPYKVNLSSERVRLALSMVEGIQQGQSLAELLGYQLERGLHDNNTLELDIYIYELRKVFPLKSNKINKTAIRGKKIAFTPELQQKIQEEEDAFKEDKAISKIEADNVVNGLALLEHIRKTGNEDYPFGFELGSGIDKLMEASPAVGEAINAEVQRLKNIRDAVADIAISEGVHQVVQGNYDRAAGALDSYSKGSYPQIPEVSKSNDSGVSLTHRFGIHLQSGVSIDANDNPRIKVEAAVNQWLIDLLPDPSKIVCQVTYKLPAYEDGVANPEVKKIVQLSQLGLSPVDILYMLNVESDKSLTALDDYILKYIHNSDIHGPDTPRPDIELQISYAEHIDDNVSFFELAPLIDSLRTLILSSRPLKPTDMALQTEAAEGEVPTVESVVNSGRIQAARQDIDALVALIKADVIDVLDALIDKEDTNKTLESHKTDILDQIDTLLGVYVTLLHKLSLYGLQQSGFGFVYDRKAAIFKAVYEKVVKHKKRWEDKKEKYRILMEEELPLASNDNERIAIFKKAEMHISTELALPGTDVAAYLARLANQKSDFDAKLLQMQAFLDGTVLSLKSLFDEVAIINNQLDGFDFVVLDTEDEERQTVVLAEDLFKHSEKLHTSLGNMTGEAQNMIDDAGKIADSQKANKKLIEAARKIFGEDFVILPEFVLGVEQANELQKCFADKNQVLDYQRNNKSDPFPMDSWLYGVARVREKIAAWENMIILDEGLKDRPGGGLQVLDLNPFQLPHKENDHWVGLEYPEYYVIESDKLLYTAYSPDFDSGKAICGLMVDEWTEVIPASNETTGLSFHYDQPNSEPAQSMLLMMPSVYTGGWQWDDLVAGLHETLDLARLRAIEPDHIDTLPYARLIPATVATVTTFPVTIALNYIMEAGFSNVKRGDNNG